MSDRENLQTKYKKTRSNLLLVVAFTVINIILLVAKSDTYFLFSATIPYLIVGLGMLICGMYPDEYYVEELLDPPYLPQSAFWVFLILALIITLLYLVSWIFSKNNKVGWLIFSLILFLLDTVGMLFFIGIDIGNIIDVIFHAWIIVSLSIGIHAHFKLKKLPPDEQSENVEIEQVEQETEDVQNSCAIRTAEKNIKSRTLLEGRAFGHTVVYRRVKKVNELVIDGDVYDEYTALFETAHSLKATIDGHEIEMGYDGKLYSYFKIDGKLASKKIRLY